MPMYIVERELLESFEPDEETLQRIDEYNRAHDIRWITSFLSPDRKKTYCLYEVDDVEVLRQHAVDMGVPADVIIEVDELVR